jgi:hypothetical protein
MGEKEGFLLKEIQTYPASTWFLGQNQEWLSIEEKR